MGKRRFARPPPLLDFYRPKQSYKPGVYHDIWTPSQEVSTCHRGCKSCRYQQRSTSLNPYSPTDSESSSGSNTYDGCGHGRKSAYHLHYAPVVQDYSYSLPRSGRYRGRADSGVFESSRGDLVYFKPKARLFSLQLAICKSRRVC